MKLKLPDTISDHTCDSYVNQVADALDLKTAAGRIFLRIALENTLLMDAKQQDYGSRNISAFGTQGVIVRMSDKFERLKNLFGKKRRRAINESVLDTFRDISNYANIALMCENHEWPNE